MLKDLGEKLLRSFEDYGMVVRLGGEEFCVLFRNGAMDIFSALNQFRSEIAESFVEYDDLILRYTLSIGLCTGMNEKMDSMLRRADTALYRAKQNGRNRLECEEG